MSEDTNTAAGNTPVPVKDETADQILAAGGVSKRRRGTSSSVKRRSPSSGARRRAPTPEPPKDMPIEDDEPEVVPVKPKKRTRDKSAKRSLSSPGDDRTPLEMEGTAVMRKTITLGGDGTRTETIVMQSKREFRVEKVELPETDDIKKNDVKKPEENVEDKKSEEKTEKLVAEKKVPAESIWRPLVRETWKEWRIFVQENSAQYGKLISQRNRCVSALILLLIYCGMGGLVFRFTEGAFEAFYKCGVKRVKRNFVDDLWYSSHNLPEEDWKSLARRKLMELENQLHAAHEAGVTSYSGQRTWSFLNAVVYCLTVVTTIGYGHLSPSTNTGRAITIVYAIFGIPLFLILLADFGKLFTRGIKFLWAFVRRVYYTGSCRKVRRTVPVQEVMKGVQLVYDFATFRRPSQMPPDGQAGEDADAQTPLQQPVEGQPQPQPQPQPQVVPLDGHEPPSTPAPSVFEVDDEFNLPISIAIFIFLVYIFVGAAVYYIWEDWGFFESFYFVFISMSTIGFGDFVPEHPMYMMASIVYLVFGLALTSMCINVVQEKLSDSFRQASAKIGATIGLRVAEEERAATPASMPAQLVTDDDDVCPAITKSAST